MGFTRYVVLPLLPLLDPQVAAWRSLQRRLSAREDGLPKTLANRRLSRHSCIEFSAHFDRFLLRLLSARWRPTVTPQMCHPVVFWRSCMNSWHGEQTGAKCLRGSFPRLLYVL